MVANLGPKPGPSKPASITTPQTPAARPPLSEAVVEAVIAVLQPRLDALNLRFDELSADNAKIRDELRDDQAAHATATADALQALRDETTASQSVLTKLIGDLRGVIVDLGQTLSPARAVGGPGHPALPRVSPELTELLILAIELSSVEYMKDLPDSDTRKTVVFGLLQKKPECERFSEDQLRQAVCEAMGLTPDGQLDPEKVLRNVRLLAYHNARGNPQQTSEYLGQLYDRSFRIPGVEHESVLDDDFDRAFKAGVDQGRREAANHGH